MSTADSSARLSVVVGRTRQAPGLRVLSINAYAGHAMPRAIGCFLPRGHHVEPSLGSCQWRWERQSNNILESQADVVGLQEVFRSETVHHYEGKLGYVYDFVYESAFNWKGWTIFIVVISAVAWFATCAVLASVQAVVAVPVQQELHGAVHFGYHCVLWGAFEAALYVWLRDTPLGDFLLGDISGGQVLLLRRGKVRLASFHSEPYRMGAHDIMSWGRPRVWQALVVDVHAMPHAQTPETPQTVGSPVINNASADTPTPSGGSGTPAPPAACASADLEGMKASLRSKSGSASGPRPGLDMRGDRDSSRPGIVSMACQDTSAGHHDGRDTRHRRPEGECRNESEGATTSLDTLNSVSTSGAIQLNKPGKCLAASIGTAPRDSDHDDQVQGQFHRVLLVHVHAPLGESEATDRARMLELRLAVQTGQSMASREGQMGDEGERERQGGMDVHGHSDGQNGIERDDKTLMSLSRRAWREDDDGHTSPQTCIQRGSEQGALGGDGAEDGNRDGDVQPASSRVPVVLFGDLNARYRSQTITQLGLWSTSASAAVHCKSRADTKRMDWRTWDNQENILTAGSSRELDGKLDWIMFHPGGDTLHCSAGGGGCHSKGSTQPNGLDSSEDEKTDRTIDQLTDDEIAWRKLACPESAVASSFLLRPRLHERPPEGRQPDQETKRLLLQDASVCLWRSPAPSDHYAVLADFEFSC